MNISQIRYKNAQYLAELAGGISAVAEKLGKAQPQVSHLLAENPVKNIGNKIARQFEEAFNKPEGWLDNLHPELLGEVPEVDNAKDAIDGLTEEAISFARIFQTLPQEQRAVLINTAEAFIDSAKYK
ncbi:MAG: LysR family transcriptional regulator [Methyloprofundus sp.]|nr:LysR family transcriptional regulator [Methyloprofundus sp.]